jgi:hypothetical protein
MSESRDERPREADDRGWRMLSTGFDEYAAARERYFEQLRMDSEVRRLERSWRLPAFRSGPDEGATA